MFVREQSHVYAIEYQVSSKETYNAQQEIKTSLLCLKFVGNTKWNVWGNWRECDKSCGDGTAMRERTCSGGAGNCVGSSQETKLCNVQACSGKCLTKCKCRFTC